MISTMNEPEWKVMKNSTICVIQRLGYTHNESAKILCFPSETASHRRWPTHAADEILSIDVNACYLVFSSIFRTPFRCNLRVQFEIILTLYTIGNQTHFESENQGLHWWICCKKNQIISPSRHIVVLRWLRNRYIRRWVHFLAISTLKNHAPEKFYPHITDEQHGLAGCSHAERYRCWRIRIYLK